MTGDALQKILARTRAGEGGCRLWIGAASGSGYPRIWNGQTHATRRWLVEAMRGRKVPIGHVVTTTCGHRLCIAADHLLVTSHAENQARRITIKPADVRLRMQAARRRRAKLDIEKAREIRRRAADGETATRLAREFGVSLRTACCVINGRMWKETRWIPL